MDFLAPKFVIAVFSINHHKLNDTMRLLEQFEHGHLQTSKYWL